jgi:hypothetical protein
MSLQNPAIFCMSEYNFIKFIRNSPPTIGHFVTTTTTTIIIIIITAQGV